jgi:DNA-binding PadR family transcriptional regulator
MARVNNSYYAIHGILSVGPMSGYQIKMWVDEGVSYFQEIDYKQIYPTLNKIVAEGLADYEVVKSGNRPESKVYHLTDQGINKFKEWLVKPIPEGKKDTNELMLKLFFGHNLPIEINVGHIERFKASRIKALQDINRLNDLIENASEKDTFWHYRMATVNKGKILYESEIDWCNKTIEYLKVNVR